MPPLRIGILGAARIAPEAVIKPVQDNPDLAAKARSRLNAPDETVILLQPPLPLVGGSIGIERGCQQTDSFVRGYPGLRRSLCLLLHDAGARSQQHARG